MFDNNKNFDSKTILMVVVVAIFYLGWQSYLSNKYPNMNKPANSSQENSNTQDSTNPQTVESKSENAEVVDTKGNKLDSKSLLSVKQVIKVQEIKPEVKLTFKSEDVNFDVSSRGMGLSNVNLPNYKNENGQNIEIGKSDAFNLFQMNFASTNLPVNFEIRQKDKNTFVGVANINGMVIERTMEFVNSIHALKSDIVIKNPNETLLSGFHMYLPEKIHKNENSSWLFPSYFVQEFSVLDKGKVEAHNINNATENLNVNVESSGLIAVSSQYFSSILLDKSEILPSVKLTTNIASAAALAEVTYKPIQLKNEMKFSQVLYVGAKSIDKLKLIDEELIEIMHFGFFSFIAKPLLSLLKFMYLMVGNWGVAIILLTLLVRLIVLPFNIMSIRSMKAMQKIQPAINALREKYKEDPVTLNREMMTLMKESGANPLGGCLPMLLQIPIFFALYRMIGSSVELYQSPFYLWITDLSAHDKFYVLPVLMGVLMFLQQKMTPTTMDPTQAKILAFMPLVFSVFMLNLPSGLTLYMFVSTLFGFVQQYIMLKDKRAAA